jgi:hypothetical protein
MVTIFMGNEEDKELLNKTLELSGSGHLMEIKVVPTTPYGSQGMMPMQGHCPEYPDNDISCVGSSGDNMCGGFMGSEGDVVFCSFAKKDLA